MNELIDNKIDFDGANNIRRNFSSVMASPSKKIKVAVTDIDGVMRGKYLSKDKFSGAISPKTAGGFGFCDVVFGWDMHDQCYDNTQLTGWQHGYPDATAKVVLESARQVPWDDNIPFFLGEFIKPDGSPYPICPRQILKRVLDNARNLGFKVMAGMEFEWYNYLETPKTWQLKQGVSPDPLTPGMFGYSLLRMNMNRDFLNAIQNELELFGVPIEGLHTETGPGVFEAALAFCEALEQADRAVLFKTSVKEIGYRFGIMPSFMAKPNSNLPGCSGHIHQSLSDGTKNVFYDNSRERKMSAPFESYLAGQLKFMMEFGPMIWPTINSYKRLVDGYWAPVKPSWGIDNRTASFRVIAGSSNSTRLETRCPGADVNPYLAMAAVIAAGLEGINRNLKLTTAPITGTNSGSDHIPRAPRTLKETTQIFSNSTIARNWLGDEFVEHFSATREWEWRIWQDAVTDWELKRYFEII